MERFPYVTIVLTASSYGFYFLPNRSTLLAWFAQDPTGQLVAVLLHPIFHISMAHLVGNTIFGLAVVGTLIETWMIQLRHLFRYGILLCCYLVSLGVTCLVWAESGTPAIGLSGVVFAAVPFTFFYYVTFSDRIDLIGLSVFAPIGIGFSIAALVLPIVAGITEMGHTVISESSMLHLLATIPSFVIASLLFQRIGKEKRHQPLLE